MPYIRPTGAGVVGMQLLRAGALLLVHGVWVCVGATYIGVVLFVLTWAWVVLAGEGLGRTSVVRHTLEYTCLVTLVVQMYTNCVMGHAMFFVRAGGWRAVRWTRCRARRGRRSSRATRCVG